MNFTQLKQKIARLEKTIGTYSTAFWSMDEHNTVRKAQKIPFEQKPAQQFLSGLGGSNKSTQALSIQLKNTSKPYQVAVNNDVTVKGLDFRTKANTKEANANSGLKLIVTIERIKELVASAKIYINTHLFPEGLYAKALGLVKAKDTSVSEEADMHWQNLALGVCHAQRIDLLVHSSLGHKEFFSSEKTSRTTLKVGAISTGEPAILLLSSPILKYDDPIAQKLTQEQRTQLLEGMYRNLFDACIREEYECIALPPMDFSSSNKMMQTYLSALMNVAKEYPNLAILCHPGIHQKEFTKALQQQQVENIFTISKDIVVIADRLVKEGVLCALHNPSDVDVVYGHCDVGGTWKTGKNKQFSFEQYIASISTAPLNSKGFNPRVYENLIERPLKKLVQEDHEEQIGYCNQVGEEPLSARAEGKNREVSPIRTPVSAVSFDFSSVHSQDSLSLQKVPNNTPYDDSPLPSPFMAIAKKLSPMLASARLFQQPKRNTRDVNKLSLATTSSLNEEQLEDIRKTIEQLNNEIKSCWPYPNKHLKQIKINALVFLVSEAESKTITESVKSAKKGYPNATDGLISTRTADLLEKLLLKDHHPERSEGPP